MPSAASVAANTPFRAALANAHPFHMLSSRTGSAAGRCWYTPAMPTAGRLVASNPISLAAAAAEEIAP
ncbi:MAG: hypothetical protein U0871_19405 [Gemmataceae bacterium]